MLKRLINMKCANCPQKPVHKCYGQGFDCTGGKLEVTEYGDNKVRSLLTTASTIEARHYMQLTRLEEIIMFARQLNYSKLGLAFCLGLAREAGAVAGILEKDFSVVSVCCKVMGLDKKIFGVENIRNDRYEAICNPVGQAGVLAAAGTDLNIALGLCVGHDAVFSMHSKAPVTTLAVKDRVLAHNPLGGIYSGYYLKNKFKLTD